ncbi:helix-turn-helix transcriptional regulator [Acinetobacter sp. S40]|uniref:AraC family transcriptional regulator n=1 Tax=unclassified Acinetobacter TaxID=196816 RepID=UPI00190BB52A|nr:MULTISPECIES: helix-turn-helix transcriptional regulator [unclassified Acinetobacter]MBJ9986394.1 helix-turn-helix transcriptional regulator [Acinetobacter sp. S40]MBK0063668.1 helix-turn-helix transcriptional regulator [Acinetobacter sp. S55]MBK0067546.1 helix-turn-helix transcriptional regulator [Acinetobacter sp. S54]
MTLSLVPSELMIGLSSEHRYREVTYAHAHLQAQLLYASKGAIQVFTGHQVWIMPPMCALWIPPRVEHSVISLSHVQLNTALVEENAAKAMGKNCFLIRVSNLLHELLIRFNELDQLRKSDPSISQEISHALQIIIFNEIQRANSLAVQIPWPKEKRLIKICETLLQSPNQLKDLNTWADEIGTSSRTLMRMFQKETGLSYRAWIQQMHIALALSKIADGLSVSQISESLGYANASAFSAMFKRHLGKTPQQFRTEIR